MTNRTFLYDVVMSMLSIASVNQANLEHNRFYNKLRHSDWFSACLFVM